MARNTIQLAPDNSTDSNFQAWASAIPSILAAGGFVQTDDTGQADFSTITRPLTTNASQGYQIWRSNTGGNEWYLKIEVGSSNWAPAHPAIWLKVGWGSDGAGNITGNATPRTQIGTGSSSTTLFDSNLWADNDEVSIFMFASSSSNGLVFNIERIRDTTGAKQDIIHIWSAGGIGFLNHVIPMSGNIPTAPADRNIGQCNIPAANSQYNSNFGLSQHFPIMGGLLMPLNNIFGADSSNFTGAQGLHTFTVFGATRTYILNNIASNTFWSNGHRILTRYDL